MEAEVGHACEACCSRGTEKPPATDLCPDVSRAPGHPSAIRAHSLIAQEAAVCVQEGTPLH